jgi:hypothetical protein
MSDNLTHVESNTKIYYTTEYGMFKFLKGNRDINEAKVSKIKDAIRDGIDILKYAPIIVNENMEIIDGQHRFAVSRELKSNVYYVIHREADLTIVPSINSNSTKWRTVDFLNSYLDLKKEEYITLSEFMQEYPRVGLPVAIRILHDGRVSGKSEAADHFRDGLFKVSHLEKAKTLTTLLLDFEGHTENPYSSRFYEAISQLRNNGKYNHDHLLAKLVESGRRIDNVITVKSIIENMESIANHKSKHRIIIV